MSSGGVKIVHVRVHALDERMPLGNQLGETRIRLHLGGPPGQEQCGHKEQYQHDRPVAEDEPFGEARLLQRWIL